MNLHVHLWTNLEYFNILNKWFLLSQGKKDRELAWFFMENFPWELAETISPQYEINFMAIRELKRKFGSEYFNKINGIYYWSDNCEYLVPHKKELEKAIEKFKEFNKNYPPHMVRSFTLVTPYVWNEMLKRLEESLKYLNELKIKNPLEIVINDFGTLRLINKKYTNLKPIFWRIIHKLLKTPLIDTYGYKAHPAWELIKNKSQQEKLKLREEIVKWQMRFYNSAEVNLKEYQSFLNKFSINRVTLDYMQKRKNLYDNSRFPKVWIDLYYPWAIIFTWRLCDTAAIELETKWMYATDQVCPRICNKYDIFYNIRTTSYKMIQRWNAWYRSELNLDFLKDDFMKNQNNRLIFSPFIPV